MTHAHYRFLPSLEHRHLEPELMDDPALDPALHRDALRGLARLNALSFATSLLWRHLKKEPGGSGERLRVLDVACGSGEVLAAIVRRGKGRLEGLGLDISPVAVAQAKAMAAPDCAFIEQDVLDPGRELPPCDVALCSLFLHHLTGEQATSLLARMARAARRVVIVSDLERSVASWFMVWAAARLVTRSPIVHFDSAGSIRAAWKAGELLGLARAAGLPQATVHRAFPARLVLVARLCNPSVAVSPATNSGTGAP